MIDFNDTAAPAENTRRVVSDAEREALRAELLARLESVLFTLFPAGKKRRGKFLIGDVLGSPATVSRSCSMATRRGCGPIAPTIPAVMCTRSLAITSGST